MFTFTAGSEKDIAWVGKPTRNQFYTPQHTNILVLPVRRQTIRLSYVIQVVRNILTHVFRQATVAI